MAIIQLFLSHLPGAQHLFLAIIHLAAYSTALSTTASPPLTSFRLLQYNIHAWRDSNHIDNLARIASTIRACNPDVVCLNEVLHPYHHLEEGTDANTDAQQSYLEAVRRGEGRGYTLPIIDNEKSSYLDELVDKTGMMGGYRFHIAHDDGYFGRIPFGNAVLSKHPILGCSAVPLKVEEGDLTLGDQGPRDNAEARVFVSARIRIPLNATKKKHDGGSNGDSDDGFNTNRGLEVGICLTHLDHIAEKLRERQVRQCIDAMTISTPSPDRQPPLPPHIFCGDLNTFRKSDFDGDDEGWGAILDLYASRGWGVPMECSPTLSALDDAGYVDAFYSTDVDVAGTVTPQKEGATLFGELEDVGIGRGRTPGPTCWTETPLMRIDHVRTSPICKEDTFALRPSRYSRVLVDGSDHLPVLVDFDLVSLLTEN